MRLSSLLRVRPLLASGLLLAGATAVHALPVFPGAIGYGTDTIAARNATSAAIYRVTNLNDAGPNSLREFVENRTGPRVIIFDVSGVIPLVSDLVIRDDSFGNHGNLIIAGQTAPFPGITLKNCGIDIRSHDVLIQHIAIRPGNVVPSPNPIAPNLGYDNKDCIKIGATSGHTTQRIVFDHVTCTWAMDETASVWSDVSNITDVTFLNCIFAYPILNGEPGSGGQFGSVRVHSKGSHGYGPLAGRGSQRTSFIRNLMAFNTGRNPLIRDTTGGAEVVNNLIYHPGINNSSVVQIGDLSGPAPKAVSLIGNVFIRRPAGYTMLKTGPAVWNASLSRWDYPAAANASNNTYYNQAVYVNNDLVTGAGLYMADNTLFNASTGTWGPPAGNQWHTDFYKEETGGTNVLITHLGANPYPNSGGTSWSALPNAVVKDTVIDSAGKFPGNRDALDSDLATHVRNGTGFYLQRLSDLGSDPWSPVNVQNTRVLPLPANPTSDTDGDGYKNFEEWLHSISTAVEGAPSGTSLNSSISTFDTFTDGNANGWSPIGFADWSVVSGAYRQSLNVDGARAMLSGTNWTHQVVQARVKPLSFNGNSRFIALYARHRDYNNSYYLTMRGAPENRIEVRKVVNGVASTIGTVTHSLTPTLGTWYTLRLEVSGTSTVTLKAYLNNGATPIITATDAAPPTQLASGKAGVGTYYATAEFDDVFASPFTTDRPQITSDFDTGSTTGWTPAVGTWSAASGVYTHTDEAAVTARVTGGTAAAAQSIQSDVRLNVVGDSTRWGGVYARYADVNNCYYLLLRASGALELKKLSAGAQTLYQSYAAGTIPMGQWNTLRLEVSGTNPVILKGYLNGVLRVQGSDAAPLANAGAALGTNYADVSFDDVTYTVP